MKLVFGVAVLLVLAAIVPPSDAISARMYSWNTANKPGAEAAGVSKTIVADIESYAERGVDLFVVAEQEAVKDRKDVGFWADLFEETLGEAYTKVAVAKNKGRTKSICYVAMTVFRKNSLEVSEIGKKHEKAGGWFSEKGQASVSVKVGEKTFLFASVHLDTKDPQKTFDKLTVLPQTADEKSVYDNVFIMGDMNTRIAAAGYESVADTKTAVFGDGLATIMSKDIMSGLKMNSAYTWLDIENPELPTYKPHCPECPGDETHARAKIGGSDPSCAAFMLAPSAENFEACYKWEGAADKKAQYANWKTKSCKVGENKVSAIDFGWLDKIGHWKPVASKTTQTTFPVYYSDHLPIAGCIDTSGDFCDGGEVEEIEELDIVVVENGEEDAFGENGQEELEGGEDDVEVSLLSTLQAQINHHKGKN